MCMDSVLSVFYINIRSIFAPSTVVFLIVDIASQQALSKLASADLPTGSEFDRLEQKPKGL